MEPRENQRGQARETNRRQGLDAARYHPSRNCFANFFLLDKSGRRFGKLTSNRSFLLFASSSRSPMPFLGNGLEDVSKRFYNQFLSPVVGQACRRLGGLERSPLWLCRFDRITLRRANACSGQANHESLFTHSTRLMLACIELVEMLRVGLSPFTFHLSSIPHPLTSHSRVSGLTVRFQGLFLAFS